MCAIFLPKQQVITFSVNRANYSGRKRCRVPAAELPTRTQVTDQDAGSSESVKEPSVPQGYYWRAICLGEMNRWVRE